MFTGIIEEVGTIQSLTALRADQMALTIGCSMIQNELKIGDSVSVDGVCLTVVRFNTRMSVFELSSETLKNSLFSRKKTGETVNLERALRLGDRLGGHMVQGHVDALATVLSIEKAGEFYEILFTLDQTVKRYVIHKGSIAVNGISLTIAELQEDRFRVAIIPHTYHETSLSQLAAGHPVHIETDMIGRYVERLLMHAESEQKPERKGLTRAFLSEHGF